MRGTQAWWRGGLNPQAGWLGLSLALMMMMFIWCLAGGKFRATQPSTAAEMEGEPPILDSFSEPGVACAILKQETHRLAQAYDEQRDLPPGPQRLPIVTTFKVAARPMAVLPNASAAEVVTRSRLEPAPVKSLVDLDGRVRKLGLELDRTMLTIYFENQRWNEFMDRYLQFLGKAADRTELLSWCDWGLASALDCAQNCGRTEELTDAVRHLIRFHGELKSVQGLKSALESWEAQNSARTGENDKS